jgi:hypothetical protein
MPQRLARIQDCDLNEACRRRAQPEDVIRKSPGCPSQLCTSGRRLARSADYTSPNPFPASRSTAGKPSKWIPESRTRYAETITALSYDSSHFRTNLALRKVHGAIMRTLDGAVVSNCTRDLRVEYELGLFWQQGTFLVHGVTYALSKGITGADTSGTRLQGRNDLLFETSE